MSFLSRGPSLLLQNALLRTQSEKDKIETDLLKHQEKATILEGQVGKAQKDRENLQAEMEMLLDRINKLSELLDKARVGFGLGLDTYTLLAVALY